MGTRGTWRANTFGRSIHFCQCDCHAIVVDKRRGVATQAAEQFASQQIFHFCPSLGQCPLVLDQKPLCLGKSLRINQGGNFGVRILLAIVGVHFKDVLDQRCGLGRWLQMLIRPCPIPKGSVPPTLWPLRAALSIPRFTLVANCTESYSAIPSRTASKIMPSGVSGILSAV